MESCDGFLVFIVIITNANKESSDGITREVIDQKLFPLDSGVFKSQINSLI